MGEQLELFPSGLSRSQLECLSRMADDASGKSTHDLLKEVDEHLDRTNAAFQRNRIVNLRLATAIGERIRRVLSDWEAIPISSRNWLVGAVFYFSRCNDGEPDFDSPIGFEDDAEVLNACLRLAGLTDLCLNVEDYDDA